MPNPFVHVELDTTNLGQAKDFYSALFDWDMKDVKTGPTDTYTTIGVGDGTGGGMSKHPMQGAPSIWIPYVDVDDVAEATRKAKQLGARIITENETVPDMGIYSIIIDPTGATIGLWEDHAQSGGRA